LTTQEDRFLLLNKVLDVPGGAVLLLPEDACGDEDEDDDAKSVVSVASSASSLASELAGPSSSKAKKTKAGKKNKDGRTKDGKKKQKKKSGVPRIIGFASNFGLKLLRKSETWSSDGTFSVCPPPFYQFYSIHAHVGQNAYPAAFFFMPGKKRIHYHVSSYYPCLVK
jgi:hypothetical protein